MVDVTPETKRIFHILLAEDDDEFRRSLASSLRKHGYDVTPCRHGLDLLGHLHSLETPARPEDFDLIITDVRMPGTTGMSVLRGLGQFDGIPPIMLITAFGDEELHAEARRLGAAAVMDKPFELESFLDMVGKILSRA